MAVRILAALASVPLAFWAFLGITGAVGKFVPEAKPAVIAAAVGAIILAFIAFWPSRRV
jgi:hypothetical protein